jgi:hypothetical protein
MPLLTSWGATNKIPDGEDVLVRKVYTYTGALPPEVGDKIGSTRKDIVSRYRHVFMEYATAQDCRDTLNDPPDVVAQLRRNGDCGSYDVDVAETTEGEWEDILYEGPSP